jgi:hypothetical protein
MIGDVIIHNSSQDQFQGQLEIISASTIHGFQDSHDSHDSCKNSAKNEYIFKSKRPLIIHPNRPLKVTSIVIIPTSGTVVRLKLYNQKGDLVGNNFSFPLMEPPRTLMQKILQKIDVRFDGWWRKYMIKLMELDRIKTDVRDWEIKRKKQAGRN